MFLIVGLGNPGEKYEKTRHNIGFRIVDLLVDKTGWKKNKKANCLYTKKQIGKQLVEIIKPHNLMNNSGQSVKYIQKKHYLKVENIMVVHDDIDLPLGTIRIGQNISSAGHKGIQSIIDHLGTQNFIRFRIGIRPLNEKPIETEKFVLKNFNKEEKKIIDQIIELSKQAVLMTIEQGLKKSMNQYN
ncbi:aminoacyl-tRNA hydrolase [Patescibacteria group bacterium]|nr:aminoacyl-tRNA hydrolase [Patescibacteria group bacterium]